MPAKRRIVRKKPPRKLYLGAWLLRLGYKRNEVFREAGITETYLSELISNKKKNPSVDILLDISEFIGVPVNNLYFPPPTSTVAFAMQGLSQEAQARLSSRRPS